MTKTFDATGLSPSNKGAWFYEATRPFEEEGSWQLMTETHVGEDIE